MALRKLDIIVNVISYLHKFVATLDSLVAILLWLLSSVDLRDHFLTQVWLRKTLSVFA